MESNGMDRIGTSGRVREYFLGFRVSRCIFVVVNLGVPEIIGKELDSKKSIDEIAKECKCNSDNLYRLMRAMSYEGIFKELENKYFQHTSLSLDLTQSHVKNEIRFMCGPLYHGFESLEDTIKNGNESMSNMFNMDGDNNNNGNKNQSYWEVLKKDQKINTIFNNFMTTVTSFQLEVTKFEPGQFNQFETVCDVGGGTGVLIKNILKHNDQIKVGINFDQPHVFNSSDNEDRYKVIGGDFFKEVPKSDCYLLKWIIHDWDDSHALEILNTISKSINKNGKIYIIDYIYNDIGSNFQQNRNIAWADVMLLHICNGKERSRPEMEQLIQKSPFKIDSIKPPTENFFHSLVTLSLK